MFDKISEDVRSFDALPREAWMALGIVELFCTVGLIVPAALMAFIAYGRMVLKPIS